MARNDKNPKAGDGDGRLLRISYSFQSINDGVNGVPVSFQSFDNDDDYKSFQSKVFFDDGNNNGVYNDNRVLSAICPVSFQSFDDIDDGNDDGFNVDVNDIIFGSISRRLINTCGALITFFWSFNNDDDNDNDSFGPFDGGNINGSGVNADSDVDSNENANVRRATQSSSFLCRASQSSSFLFIIILFLVRVGSVVW